MADETPSVLGTLPSGPKYTFTIPEKDRQLPTDPKTFTLQLVLLAQQLEAEKIAEGKKTAAVWEVIKHGLVAVDGRALGWDNAAKEQLLEGLSPRARSRIVNAFTHLHVPDEGDDADFLGQVIITV